MKVTITLDEHDWGTVQQALFAAGGELAASEARRTGGNSMASGSKIGHLDDILRIRAAIRTAVEPGRHLA